jgi:hypothetical protein
MSDKLYHISCADNDASIMAKGLIPGEKPGYEEEKSSYIFLARKKPTKNIRNFEPDKNLLDDYLLQMSVNLETCPIYNLYEVDRAGLDPSRIVATREKREIAYQGTIPPQYITLIKTYDTRGLNERYLTLNRGNWWE